MDRMFGRGTGHRAIAAGLAIVVVALMLSACGKKGSPVPPADEPHTYPRAYPSE